MGNSLQNYRMTIGMFTCHAAKLNRTSKSKVVQCSPVKGCTLAWLLIFGLLTVCGFQILYSLISVKPDSSSYNLDQGFFSRKLREIDHNFQARCTYGNRKKTGLRLAHLNMGRGLLCNKINELERIISTEKPHVIGISETQFDKSQDINELKIDRYSIYFSDTLSCPSLNVSRIAVLVHEDVTAKVRHDLMNKVFGSIWLELGFKNQKKILVSNVY